MNPDMLMLFDKMSAALPLYEAAETSIMSASRIAEVVEPYPNRWTHHVMIASPEDFDAQVMAWLRESYDFSMIKGRKRP